MREAIFLHISFFTIRITVKITQHAANVKIYFRGRDN